METKKEIALDEKKIIIPKENRVLPSVEEVYNTGY